MVIVSKILCYFAVVNIQQIYRITKFMTANEALDNYLRSLPNRERIAKSRDIREICQKSRFVLSDWRRGRTPIDIAWRDKITEALGENIFANCES